jgi:hypothetical protein
MAALAAAREVYRDPWLVVTGGAIALLTALLLTWSGQVVTFFREGGLFVDADAFTVAGILLIAVLLGFTAPLHWYMWRRARASAGQGLSAVGAVLGIGSMSCCAPLLLPGLLSLVGVSGTSLLALNLRLHQLRLPLLALSVGLLLVSLAAGLRGVSRSCVLRP